MRKLVTMREALSRPDYFATQLAGESWANWRLLLIAIAGEPLEPRELETFKALTGRQRAPLQAPREFWAIVGRRGGKSRAAAALAAWLGGCKDHRGVLAPGERGQLIVLAQTREQAGNCFNFICGVFDASLALRGLVENRGADTLSLKSGVDIVVKPASYRSVRGPTAIGAICDEIGYWRDPDTSANPDQEILRALRPSLLTTGGPLIAISSPYSRKGQLWENYHRHYGQDGSRVLVAQAPSWVMHPALDRAWIDEQFEADPVAADAEFGGNFRNDIDAFIRREIVEAVVVPGRFELGPITQGQGCNSYYGFVDPSGGGADSFTLGIAHLEGNMAILDLVREAKPPFSPSDVVGEFAETLRQYGLHRVIGDRYSGEFVRELFSERGVSYEVSERSKSEIYVDLLPLLNSRRIELIDHPKLIGQLCALERRTVRGSGRDVIDHPPGASAHDDLINAAAGALVGVGCGNDAVATFIRFGEALADPPVIRTDLDPATRAALIWRARGSGWRNYATNLDAEVIEALEGIEHDAVKVLATAARG
jgi:hypothetical protein